MAGASRAAIPKTRVVARIAVKYMARSKLKVEKGDCKGSGAKAIAIVSVGEEGEWDAT